MEILDPITQASEGGGEGRSEAVADAVADAVHSWMGRQQVFASGAPSLSFLVQVRCFLLSKVWQYDLNLVVRGLLHSTLTHVLSPSCSRDGC